MLFKYCFELTEENKLFLNEMFSISGKDYPLISKLKQNIEQTIPWILKYDEAISTAVFTLIGIYCYCLCKGVEFPEEDCISFVMLYINLDYALDGDIDIPTKKKIISEIYSYLNEEDVNPTNFISKASIELIKCLESKVSRKTLLFTFQEEIKSVKIQYTSSSRKELRESCFYKSKMCIDLISELIMIDEDYAFEIGKCLQLFDDLFDIEIDKDNGITTYAIQSLQEVGNVDLIIKELLEEAEKIDSLGIKIFFTYAMIIYCTSSKYVGKELREEAHKYYPFCLEGSDKSRIKDLCLRIFRNQK